MQVKLPPSVTSRHARTVSPDKPWHLQKSSRVMIECIKEKRRTLTERKKSVPWPVAKESLWHEFMRLLPVPRCKIPSESGPQNTTPTWHTIIMQAGHVKRNLRSCNNGECRLSTIGVAHSQGGIFHGYLRDSRRLMAMRLLLTSDRQTSKQTYWGTVDLS